MVCHVCSSLPPIIWECNPGSYRAIEKKKGDDFSKQGGSENGEKLWSKQRKMQREGEEEISAKW